MGKLVVGLARFLLLCALLLALPTIAAAQQAGALVIDLVWTTDGNGNDKTTFMPGDAIRYTTIIRNTYNSPVNMWIYFEASGPLLPGSGVLAPAFRYIYTYIQRDVIVPVGLAGYYSPWTIPSSAQPGTYGIQIGICWNESSVTTGTNCSGTGTANYSLFSVPGTLATDITTFLSDGVTPTSAVGEAGPGGALFYKISVTNTSSANNTGVVLTDQLPPEIFDIIGTPTTDHGTCDKSGSWPSTTITCRLGSLAPHETATIYFTASIIVRHPSGEPRPPGSFVNNVYVRSDQQNRETSASVETVINVKGISDADYNELVRTVESCVGLVPGIGTLAGFVWQIIGRDIESGQPRPYPEKLVNAAELGSKELAQTVLDEIGSDVGLEDITPDLDAAECITAAWKFFYDTH
jgi:uncharacterized repeat protein (TIGR01451 family)